MPELWDLEQWPSPSMETAVQARVRSRARSILRLRVAVAAVAASLAVVVGLTDLPAPGAGVRMKSEWQPADQPREEEEHGAPPVVSPSGEAPVAHAVGAPPAATVEPPLNPVVAAPSAPVPTTRRRGLVIPDMWGDARYQTGCRTPPCPNEADLERETSSQAAYDMTSVELSCAGPALELRLDMADLDALPTPNRAGLTPDYAMFHLSMTFRDSRSTMLTFGIQRDHRTESLWSGGVLSFRSGDEDYHTFLTPGLRREGDTWVLTVPDFTAAFEAAHPGTPPLAAGTTFDLSGLSTAIYRQNNSVLMSQGVDAIPYGSPGTRAAWCEEPSSG